MKSNMDRFEMRGEVFVSGIKRIGFLVAVGSFVLYFLSRAFDLDFIHFLAVYCSLAVLAVFVFRRRASSGHSIVLLILLGSVFACLRAYAPVPLSGSYFLAFLFALGVGGVAVFLTIILDVVISAGLRNRHRTHER